DLPGACRDPAQHHPAPGRPGPAADQDPHRGKQSGGTQDHTAHAVRGTATPGRQPPARMTAGLSCRPGSGYHPDDKDVLTVGHTSAKREIDPWNRNDSPDTPAHSVLPAAW